MGSKITLKSEIDKGTEFIIRIPLSIPYVVERGLSFISYMGSK